MVTEVQYTNIQRVLDDLMEHPMLADLTLEQVVRYTVRFISKHGYNKLYQDKIADLDIHDYRALLPCDVISIIQVKDNKTDICLRSMTDTFGTHIPQEGNCIDPMNNMRAHTPYIPPRKEQYGDGTFKTQGRVLYTSFPEGQVSVAYKAIPVDDDGFPMVIDNEVYLDALEAYIKKQIFTIKFDQQKIPSGVLQNAQQDYAVASKLLLSEFTVPSLSEARTLSAIWNRMILNMREFDNGFINLGNREYLKRH